MALVFKPALYSGYHIHFSDVSRVYTHIFTQVLGWPLLEVGGHMFLLERNIFLLGSHKVLFGRHIIPLGHHMIISDNHMVLPRSHMFLCESQNTVQFLVNTYICSNRNRGIVASMVGDTV